MPEGVGYGPQFTASVGKALNFIGRHVYGYSGTITYDNNFTVGLDHSTGSEYVKCRVYWSFSEAGSDNVEMQIFMNDVLIFASEALNLVSTEPYSITYVDLLIPSFTRIKIGCLNASDSTTHPAQITLTGKSYGKVV